MVHVRASHPAARGALTGVKAVARPAVHHAFSGSPRREHVRIDPTSAAADLGCRHGLPRARRLPAGRPAPSLDGCRTGCSCILDRLPSGPGSGAPPDRLRPGGGRPPRPHLQPAAERQRDQPPQPRRQARPAADRSGRRAGDRCPGVGAERRPVRPDGAAPMAAAGRHRRSAHRCMHSTQPPRSSTGARCMRPEARWPCDGSEWRSPSTALPRATSPTVSPTSCATPGSSMPWSPWGSSAHWAGEPTAARGISPRHSVASRSTPAPSRSRDRRRSVRPASGPCPT